MNQSSPVMLMTRIFAVPSAMRAGRRYAGCEDAIPIHELTGEDYCPEFWLECPECCGEGSIEKWESVSKWSIDPPCAIVLLCPACNGAGGMICETEGNQR